MVHEPFLRKALFRHLSMMRRRVLDGVDGTKAFQVNGQMLIVVGISLVS